MKHRELRKLIREEIKSILEGRRNPRTGEYTDKTDLDRFDMEDEYMDKPYMDKLKQQEDEEYEAYLEFYKNNPQLKPDYWDDDFNGDKGHKGNKDPYTQHTNY